MPSVAKGLKGHVCPPSNAIHPADRWESLFVYSFVCKFTNLRGKVEGLETPMDFENALMSKEPNDILTRLLAQFIINLKPQTRNLSMDQISTTVASVLAEYFKSSERTIFWNEDLNANVDPFEGLEGGFFTTEWDFKLKILRQLVELQLSHSPEIKATIDRAWGVVHNKHKKKDATAAPPEPADPKSQEKLQLVPIGQDCQRKRYWVVDDSPRIYVSTNPWKITATFQTICSTREEYMMIIENLKSSLPPEPKKGQKRTRLEQAHIALIAALEGRVEAIDAELLRVQKARKKMEQKRALYAQAELRETRTRRKTQKPDYVYNNDVDSEDDGDEYAYEEEEANDEEFDDDFINSRTDAPNGTRKRQAASSSGQRRSTRTVALNANGKREGSLDSWGQWRRERRSSRLGGPIDHFDEEPPYKRARTEESTASTSSTDAISAVKNGPSNKLKLKATGAAALKPTEVALEQIAGKKRSKFWVYAVEPAPGAPPPLVAEPTQEPAATNGTHSSDIHDYETNGDSQYTADLAAPISNGNAHRTGHPKGNLSPLPLGST
ncbi:hypothetical protein BDQ12DRAFT_686158 [Crucibulum laeve]|uniref:WHIM1 domain-containing protein n=1 Tax=Crucibulum laeve TaxID=68775 RepID=A0A5C3LUV2_9AGAR|nr:hypothetical protein BDQ12DRAFT_686158 [Crucibulum laeve]